ncbi:hypothetical protein GZL_07182 [Streptomyces sp. 769]|nr:hypothetical protein GZL_07182 [Streptomyces sp. 769]
MPWYRAHGHGCPAAMGPYMTQQRGHPECSECPRCHHGCRTVPATSPERALRR